MNYQKNGLDLSRIGLGCGYMSNANETEKLKQRYRLLFTYEKIYR